MQELLKAHQQLSEQAQQNMLGYVHELESRLANLPGEIEAGLDPEQIAMMLGESLRANQRVEYSLDSRTKTMDALLHEWKSDLLRIWIPMIAGLHFSRGHVWWYGNSGVPRVCFAGDSTAICSTRGSNSPTRGKRRGGRESKPAGP